MGISRDVAVIKGRSVKTILCIGYVVSLVAVSGLAHAQRSSELSADLPDGRTMAIQAKVETLFKAGEFGRAFFIYQNELAPLGDKYAQYMIGYMLQNGMGVAEDSVAAAAWYRLAAERGTPEFAAVRDGLLGKMTENEVRRADAAYFRLRVKYSDLAVLLSSIQRNLRELDVMTGSRIQGNRSTMTIVQTRGGRIRSGADYYEVNFSELEDRLELLKEMDGFQDIETDPRHANLRELERRVQEKIESVD